MGAATFEATESRYDARAREMHRDFDAAVEEFASVSLEFVTVFRELDSMCTVMIDAVDKWHAKTRIRRFGESMLRKVASVLRRDA